MSARSAARSAQGRSARLSPCGAEGETKAKIAALSFVDFGCAGSLTLLWSRFNRRSLRFDLRHRPKAESEPLAASQQPTCRHSPSLWYFFSLFTFLLSALNISTLQRPCEIPKRLLCPFDSRLYFLSFIVARASEAFVPNCLGCRYFCFLLLLWILILYSYPFLIIFILFYFTLVMFLFYLDFVI